MADLTQAPSSLEPCTVCVDMTNNFPQILGFDSGSGIAHTERLSKHDEDKTQQNLSDYGDGYVVNSVPAKVDKVLSQKEEDRQQQSSPGDGYGKLSSHMNCNPICTEGELKQVEKEEECGLEMGMKQDGNGGEEVVSQKWSENACAVNQEETCGISCKDNSTDADDRVLNVHIDVEACGSQMSAVVVNVGEGQEELCCIATRPLTVTNGQNESVPGLSSARRDDQSTATPPPRRPAAWRTPEPKARVFPEPEFIMEASSWPTLAEARHTKPSEARAVGSNKEAVSVVSPTEKVPLSQANLQEHSMEAVKPLNANPSQPGPKYKPSYKKSSIPGYGGKPSFPAAENIPVPPIGAHVPSANMYVPDQSMKGNGIVGMNSFFPTPHQAPPFYYHRAEGHAPFPHNRGVMPAYGRGPPGWQHHSRGYGDAHSGFVPQYDQHIGPRHMRPPVTPFVNMNVAYYNYPNFQGDMSYMPAAPSPGYSYAAPYFGPSGSPGGIPQGPDYSTIQEMVQKQIEYYFSTANLCHDRYLTSKMDDEGFVPLSLIAGFPRVQQITTNSFLILEAMKKSSLVEVKSGKLRSHDWRRWKPSLSGTSQRHGSESTDLFVPVKQTKPDNTKERHEPGEHGFDKFSALSESRLVSGSHAAPWTGISANLGAGSVPAVTSIDSR